MAKAQVGKVPNNPPAHPPHKFKYRLKLYLIFLLERNISLNKE